MSSPEPTVSVIGMTPNVKIFPGMNPVEGHDVHFQSSSGVQGSVFVPTAQLGDLDAVAGMIRQRFSELNAIHNLTL